MGELSPWHLAIVAVVVVVLFGSKRLPDAARSLGRSLRIFKTEMKALHDDEPSSNAAVTLAIPVPAPAPAPATHTEQTPAEPSSTS